MDDITAFERLVAGRIQRHAGPIRPVDDVAIFTAIAAGQPSARRVQAMFSATKFVAAAAIVGLFGGLLLAGVLTTPRADHLSPAAVSPLPTTTEELLSGMVTEEVEPGVWRIDHDGVRDLSWNPEEAYGGFAVQLALGTDGSVWFARSGEVFRLGSDPTMRAGYDPDSRDSLVVERSAGQHVLWRAGCTGDEGEYEAEAMAATVEAGASSLEWRPEGPGNRVALGPGGSLWMLAADDAAPFRLFERIGERWATHQHPGTPTGDPCPWARDTGLWVTDDGVVWVLWGRTLSAFDGSSWTDVDVPYGPSDSWVDVGPDGTIWATWREERIWSWARYDGTSWTTYRTPDELPATLYDAMTVPHQVAPDGSLWFAVGDPPMTGECDGLARFDGTSVDRFLRGRCVPYLQVAPDGTVWALASSDGGFNPIETYAIRPEVAMAR